MGANVQKLLAPMRAKKSDGRERGGEAKQYRRRTGLTIGSSNQFPVDSILVLHNIASNSGLGSYHGTFGEDCLANANR